MNNKLGRNMPCHCGSGKKYKKCCLDTDRLKDDSAVNIVTYTGYEDIFGSFSEKKFQNLLNHTSALDCVCASAHMNMVMQTTNFQIAQEMLLNDVKRLYPNIETERKFQDQGLVIPRDTLLYVIAERIRLNNDKEKNIDPEDKKILLEIFLLANSKLSIAQAKSIFEIERGLIRNPDFMNPEALEWYFKHNYLRYNKIYSDLVKELNNSDKIFWGQIEKTFKDLTGINIIEYMETIKLLISWFLFARKLKPDLGFGFRPENPKTFYILKENFKKNPIVYNSLESLSKNFKDFIKIFKGKPKVEISNEIYKYFPYIYDNPVCEVEKNCFCILDLTYFIENICGGLKYKLFELNRTDLSDNMQEFMGVYGNLIEKYFNFLIKQIFHESAQITSNKNNQQDAIVKAEANGKKYIFVLEFTTQYYKLESLYNSDILSFEKDLFDLLFSKNRGKLRKLNKYVNEIKKKSPTTEVIPILVTERYFGDFDLLNRYNNYLTEKIIDTKLDSLQTKKPIILSLLDLETFWAGSSQGKEAFEFVNEVLEWESSVKGHSLYRFGSFQSNPKKEKRMNNEDYLKIFNIPNLFLSDKKGNS
ncbi:SEC-C domain-containing protein [Candidatus Dojkabacteria bacterium]|nr:SEC-C domain-containing protein [Candidatus Dojkabacteria bacterium]